MEGIDIQAIVRQAIQEYSEQARASRPIRPNCIEERKRREQLERRLNELVEENKRSQHKAEEAERSSTVRAELQRLGVAKIDLAFKAVQDGVVRTEDGRLVARDETGELPLRDYLGAFVSGESGVSAGADCGRKRDDRDTQGPCSRAERRWIWRGSGRE